MGRDLKKKKKLTVSKAGKRKTEMDDIVERVQAQNDKLTELNLFI